MSGVPNPVRLTVLWVGLAVARTGLVDQRRVRRTTDLAWPRILTGVARMSKTAADVAMVGIAVGPAAIAGVGFAGPYWGAAFTIGGGVAAGTIALVSQRFGAGAHDQLGKAVRASAVLVVAVTLPIAALYFLIPAELIGLLTDDGRPLALGSAYLRVLALGVPFAGLNLIGSRALVGADDARTPMVLRGGGAALNVGLNGVLIFGLGMGVVGAAWGTVLSNVVVAAAFAVGFSVGRLPGVGEFPVSVPPRGRYLDRGELRDIAEIGAPVVGRNGVWTVARFPLLALVAAFGPTVVAAYVISRRIAALMNTPGWGFGLAASSLVGQALGGGDEALAEIYGREITRFSVATYLAGALVVALFARRIVVLFVGSPADPTVSVAVPLVWASCVGVVFQGVTAAVAGALDATGDTRWPFYSRTLGMFGFAIPLVYLGTTTPLGIWGLYLAFVAQMLVPAAINYYRFSTGAWKAISREYRPDAAGAQD